MTIVLMEDSDDDYDEFQKVFITAIETYGVAGLLIFQFKEDDDRNADYGFEDYKRTITIIRRQTLFNKVFKPWSGKGSGKRDLRFA